MKIMTVEKRAIKGNLGKLCCRGIVSLALAFGLSCSLGTKLTYTDFYTLEIQLKLIGCRFTEIQLLYHDQTSNTTGWSSSTQPELIDSLRVGQMETITMVANRTARVVERRLLSNRVHSETFQPGVIELLLDKKSLGTFQPASIRRNTINYEILRECSR